MSLTIYEPIGHINSFICRHCKWMTITINLNSGVTSDIIGCNNPDQNVVDGIIDTSLGTEEGSPSNPHIAHSFNYDPIPGWFQNIAYKQMNVETAEIETIDKMRMWVERAWIRPTLAHIRMMAKDDEEKYDGILAGCLDGALVLTDLKSNWDRAEPFARYGRDESMTRAYLNDIYGVK